MFLRLLLIFPLACLAADLSNLAWQPERVTKERILAEHTKGIELGTGPTFPTLVYITPWNPRGYYLARKTVSRLSHVSPVWLYVKPKFDEINEIADVFVDGEHEINTQFIEYLQKHNPDVNIVPRFKFNAQDFPTAQAVQMMQKEMLVARIVNRIVEFCEKHKFRGLVLELLDAVYAGDKTSREIVLESIGTMGDKLMEHGLHVVFSMPAPVNYKASGEYSDRDGFLTNAECQELLDHFHFIHIWTYTDQANTVRDDIQIWVNANLKKFGFSKKILIGINYYGQEFSNTGVESITGKQFLEKLKKPDSVLQFNEKSVEHILRTKDSMIVYPSMTSLEYRITQAREKGVGIAIWDYGQGLDYFTNLI